MKSSQIQINELKQCFEENLAANKSVKKHVIP